MKNISSRYKSVGLITFSVFILLGCRKDKNSPHECCQNQITAESMERFESTANAFALDEILLNPEYSSEKIDKNISYCYLGKLSAIFNHIQPSDSNYYKLLHEIPLYRVPSISLKDFMIKFKSKAVKDAFVDNPSSINNEYINYLFNELNFGMFPMEWDSTRVRLWSEEYYYTPVLVENLLNSNGIDTAYTITLGMPEGNKIEIQDLEDGTQIDFSYSWVTSFQQSKFHYWTVFVSNSCEVKLIDEYGDELP